MSKEAITKVVQRAISDAGFRRQLSTDPTGALRGFDLSADEAAALRAGDAGRLSALGVDQRMSKAFVLGGVSLAATRPGGTDLNASNLNAGGNSALSSSLNAGDNSALNSNLNAGGNSALNSNLNAAGSNSGLSSRLSEGDNSAQSGMPNAFSAGGNSSFNSALAQGSDASRALVDDGASGIRNIIPTEPGGNMTADVDGSSDAYLTKIGYDSGAATNADASGSEARSNVIHDDPNGFLAANANAVAGGGSAAPTNAFIDDSETYLTKVGYDPEAASSAHAEGRETTWSGDDIAGSSSSDSASAGEGTATDHGDSSLTP